MTKASTFDDKLDLFKRHQETPWSKLRYAIAMINLQRHFASNTLDCIDVGGGNGVEAVMLARQGHRVVLVDYSAEMLSDARKNAAENRVSERLEFHQGDLLTLPTLFPDRRFDVALCHHVLQYIEDLDAALQAIRRVVKTNGLLSIICVNRYSEPYRLALQELNLPAALAALGADTIVSKVFAAPMKAYAAEDLRAPLQTAGFTVVGQYGIRCVNDYIPDNEIKSDAKFFAEMEKLELAMSGRFPYFLVARSFHIVAQKT